MSDEGTKYIAEAVKTNTSLQEINLESNEISHEGTKLIADVLKTNTSLQMISLKYNKDISLDQLNLIDEELINNNCTPLYPRILDIEMSDMELENLKLHIKNKTIKDFIDGYRKEHASSNLSDGDVSTLGLIKSIINNEGAIVYDTLTELYKDIIGLDPNLLVTLDAKGQSPILCALEKGKYIHALLDYIFELEESRLANKKFVIDSDLREKLADSIKNPKFDNYHPWKIIEGLIEPIYTKQSVDELIELIGKDWLDSFII
jgi:hypothetical protein